MEATRMARRVPAAENAWPVAISPMLQRCNPGDTPGV